MMELDMQGSVSTSTLIPYSNLASRNESLAANLPTWCEELAASSHALSAHHDWYLHWRLGGDLPARHW